LGEFVSISSRRKEIVVNQYPEVDVRSSVSVSSGDAPEEDDPTNLLEFVLEILARDADRGSIRNLRNALDWVCRDIESCPINLYAVSVSAGFNFEETGVGKRVDSLSRCAFAEGGDTRQCADRDVDVWGICEEIEDIPTRAMFKQIVCVHGKCEANRCTTATWRVVINSI